MSNITDNLQTKKSMRQDAQRVRMANANIFDGPRSPSIRNPLPAPVETVQPAFRPHDVANGIRQTAPGIYESAPQQNAGRVMPRPDMATSAPLQDVGTPSRVDTMRAQGAAQQAATQARLGARVPPAPMNPGAAPVNPAALGPEDFGRNMGKGLRGSARGVAGPALSGAAAAIPFAEHWDAYGNDSKLSAGEKAQLFTRDTVKAGLGLAGGATGAAVGSVAGPVGTVAGGAALGLAGYNAADPMMDDIRGGVNWVNGKLGGDPNYFRNSDDILRDKGFDPNNNIVDMAMGKFSKLQAPTAAASTVNPAPAVAPITDETPLDISTPQETNNAEKFGLSADMQRNALAQNGVSLRGGSSNKNLTTDFGQANSNMQASLRGMDEGQAYLASGLDGGDKIYATKDANGQLVLTGTGEGQGSAGQPYDAAAMNRTAALQRDVNSLRVNDARRNDPTPGVAVLGGGSLGDDLRARTDAIGAGDVPGVSARENLRNRTERNNARMAQETAQMQDATSRWNAGLTNQTNLRGQDMEDRQRQDTIGASMYGHQVSLRNNQLQREQDRTRFAAEQDNKNREFGLSSSKNDFEVQSKGTKDLNDQLGATMVLPDGSGPDVGRVGAASKAIHDEVGAMVADARKIPKNDPRYDSAQRNITKLEQQGVGALDDAERRVLISQAALRDRLMATKGVFLGGSAPRDTRLSGYEIDTRPEVVAKGQRMFGSDVVTLKNGSMIRKNDLKYTEPGNALLPNWGHVPTTQFDAGLRGAR